MTLEDQLRDSAVDLANRGFRVFPLKPNGRTPAVEGWYDFATSDPKTVKRRWEERYAGCNIGVIGHKNLLILDFDCKNDKQGMTSLDTLRICGLPEDTFTVTTPSGGVHTYLSVPQGTDITVSADRIDDFPGMDARCNGGYVIAPGSVTPKGTYTIVNGTTPSPAEPWLIEMLRPSTRLKKQNNNTPDVDLDQEPNVKRAINYLTTSAPTAEEGNGGNETTYRVAATVKDFGISESACYDLVSEHWNEVGRAEPPWDATELETLINNVYAYGQDKPGKATAEADFGPPEDKAWADAINAQSKQRKRKGLTPQNIRDAANEAQNTEEDPLIYDLLDRGAMSVVYGPSNVGKSFVALDAAYSIATNQKWLDRDTHKGSVLYIAAEGGRRFKRRLQAILKHRPHKGTIPFELIDRPIDLRTDDAHMKALIEICKDIKNVELIVIDTLSRALSGGDENSSVDMGKLVTTLDTIRQRTAAHLMVIHHSGKDQARGARGHSLLRAATDTELELTETKELWVRKQRDLDMPKTAFRFRLDSMVLKQDGQGRDVKSAAVRWLGANEFELIALSPQDMRVVRVLGDCMASAGEGGLVPSRTLHAAYFMSYGETRGGEITYEKMTEPERKTLRKTVERSRAVCIENGWIESPKRGYSCLSEEALIHLENEESGD